jgi:hypothetical protein
MDKRKKHLGYSTTLCGRDPLAVRMAKKYIEVTCKSCMQSEIYQNYLLGKYKEKPVKKSQTQGYMDIISGKE